MELTTPGGGYLFQSCAMARTPGRRAFQPAVDMLGNRCGIKLTVNGYNPLPPGIAHPVTLRRGLHGQISS